MSARLAVIGVSVSFGGSQPVLDRVDLDVEPGEIVALLGPSGSGKSTLLRVIAGLVAPDAGSIRLDEMDITACPTHRRGVGMVFQDEQLFEHLDVAANVAFGLRMRGDEPAQRNHRVAAMLGLVGLAGFESRKVTDLSGGEAKRIALARSLAPSPQVLLLDEPLTGLDRELHDRLADDLARIMRAEQTTSLLVTHDRDEAESIADRIVTIAELTPTTERSGRETSVSAEPLRRMEPVAVVEPVDVVEVEVAEVYELRRDVLRRGTPSDRVDFDGDHDPGTRHLAVRDGSGRVAAISTWSENECAQRPGVPAMQLRGMGVRDDQRRRGFGAALVEAGALLARERDITLIWANARDTAIDFYVTNGFFVVGEGFVTADTQIPHHRVIRELA